MFTILFSGLFKNYKFAIVSTFSYLDFRIYHFLCKIAGIKIILDCVESYSNMDSRLGFERNDKRFEAKAYRMSDGIFYISDLLKQQIEEKGGAKMLKVPVICDFSKFSEKETTKPDEKYFLFCGSAVYRETIEFIVESFNILEDTGTYLY